MSAENSIPVSFGRSDGPREFFPRTVLPPFNPFNSFSLINLLLIFLIAASSAPPRAAGQTLLLTGATVHTVSGPVLSPGQVLIEAGKIAAVGTNLSASGA